MKVNVKAEIKDLEGNSIPLDEKATKFLTVGNVLTIALRANLEADPEDSGETRMNKFNLLELLLKGEDTIDMSASMVTMIKERVLKVYPGAEVYGRVCEALGEIN